MNSRLKALLASLLFIVPFLTLIMIMYKVAAHNQQPMLITLESSGGVVKASGPISSIFSSSDDKIVYMVNGVTGEVEAVSSETNKSLHSLTETSGPIAIGSNGYTAQVGKDLNVAVFDLARNRIVGFPTYPATSLAVLSNGNIIVASPTRNHFLHMYSPTGYLVKSFGAIKDYDKTNSAQNQFLHKGKVLVDAFDNIYYVFHYVPLIQKFSSSGVLDYEIDVKGSAIDIQQELAQRFFSIKDATQVGGIGVINSAAIDRETGHLWICMSGSSLTGLVYEYSSYGEKLREYALEVNSSLIPSQTVVGVHDIAIIKSKLYALTQYKQVYNFDRNSGKPTRISRSNLTVQQTFLSFMPQVSFWPAFNLVSSASTQQGCGVSQTWPDCTFNCPGLTCNGNEPTNTSSNSSTQDCKAALSAALNSGFAVVASQCQQFPAGNSDHMRGGCRSDVTICRAPGNNSNHNITLDCPAPATNPCGGGGGGGECGDFQICDTGEHWDFEQCLCLPNSSPILIDAQGNGFDMTDAVGGVDFDLNSDGAKERLSWTSTGSDDAFLALDRNNNGVIDNGTELFGNFTPQPPSANPNGFLALTEYDKPFYGGNADGVIDSRDAIFSSLRLWQDTNHNGISEPNELHSLSDLGVAILDLKYKESKKTDQYGNQFRYRAKVKDVHGAQVGRWAWDVFLVKQ